MRSIQISTDVFAAIWKTQKEGETSEEAILRRLLKVSSATEPRTAGGASVGYRDPRYGVEFPEGFAIFRTYRGKDFRAKAVAGSWLLMETGDMYPSLNELSRAIGTKTENAWLNWLYLDERGNRTHVSALRNHAKIVRRKRAA